MRRTVQKTLTKLIVGAVAAGGALLVTAGPASAHAELVSTEPTAGQVLDTAPEQVVLHFSEPVDPPDDAIQVFGSSGDELDVGAVGHTGGDGKAVGVDLPALDDGAYVVTWRVSSADSHPIRGGFTFRVGEAGNDAEAEALMDELIAGEGGDSVVGITYGVIRFAAFVGLILLVGVPAFGLILWPRATSDPRARRLVVVGWLTTLVATLLSFGLQGAYAAGESLGSAVDTDVLSDVLDTRGGRVWLVRVALLVLVALAGHWLLHGSMGETSESAGEESTPGLRGFPARWRADAGRLTAVAVAGLALLATVSFAGHAASGDLIPLALLVDVVHLTAVSLWLGGLVVLLFAVLRRPAVDGGRQDNTADMEPLVAGFSTLAFGLVIAIVVTGVIQGIRQLQGLDALTGTTYGRLLITKVLVFVVLIGTAAVSRRWVQRRWSVERPVASPLPVGPGAKVAEDTSLGQTPQRQAKPDIAHLRRAVGVEVALATVVLAVTSLLVNTVPGREATSESFTAELHATTFLARVEVDPAQAGQADIEVEILTHGGEPLVPEDVTASLSLPARDIPPIPVTLEPTGQGSRYTAKDVDIPFAGTWQLDVTARTSEFDQGTATVQVPVD